MSPGELLLHIENSMGAAHQSAFKLAFTSFNYQASAAIVLMLTVSADVSFVNL